MLQSILEQVSAGLRIVKDQPQFRTSLTQCDQFFQANDINGQWKGQRSVEPKGPLVNSEFYPGWLTHWGEENQRRNADDIVDSFK